MASRNVVCGFGSLVVALCLFCFPRPAQASNNCPWINEATAGGLLDGEAVGSFSPASAGQPAICTFVYKTAGGIRTLTIHVETTEDAQTRVSNMAKGCGQPPQVLPAIGNEAYVCTQERGKQALSQRVIGRVRDQVFSITIGTTGAGESAAWMADVKARIAIAAEQVSGNLF
jgi:hypothetical protein